MLTALFGAGLIARVRQALSGPMAVAIASTGVALIVAGSIALGLSWLRNDAASDASATCEADKLRAQLAIERAVSNARQNALRQRDEMIAELTHQRARDETTIAELEKERTDAIARAREWEHQIGRGVGVVFRSDDPWLRQGRAAAGTDRSPGR